MDLKSILSPSEDQLPSSPTSTSKTNTPAPATAPAASSVASSSPQLATPHKYLERTQSGPVVASTRSKHVAIGSPLAQTPLSSIPSHVLSPHQQPTSSPLISPVPAAPGSPHGRQRTHSTQSIDTLADLASMQSHQPPRPIPFKVTSLESIKSIDSAGLMPLSQPSFTSNPRASIDINMMETPQETRRTDFSATSLPQEQKEQLSKLAEYLAENSCAYESHVAFINILHQAFIRHVYPSSTDGSILPKRDPASFELLEDLRSARTTMQKHFAVGEAIWLDWLQDESMLARTTEERIDVIEKFRKAVSEEALSCKLWAEYGDWVVECYRWANQASSSTTVDEDRLVAKEVFTPQMVLETWQEAADQTKLDIANSHLVWNKFIELRIAEFKNDTTKDQATAILGLFEQRLKTPHIASDSTKQILSTFMNNHFSQEQYFEIMEDTARVMKDAIKALEERSSYEAKIEEAQTKGDKDAEYNAFTAYVEWEKTPAKRKRLDFDTCNAVYLRAELRFPSEPSLWDDHVAFVLENARPALDLLSRATEHCPWSGSLWSQYILASDRQGVSYEVTEGIKHKATSTGVLEAAGIGEILKVHAAWCSYLRRRAFRPDRDEDDADIAEIGIRASMENINSLGAKLGVNGAPDPSFRLQRIHINFLSESGRWDNARDEFEHAVPMYGNSWQFWLRFYNWEMKRWRRFATKDPDDEPLASTSAPHLATAVLKLGLDQPSLDYPEPVIEALLNHCEDYEDADELQACLLKVRKLEKALTARRQVEAMQNATAAATVAAQQAEAGADHSESQVRPQLTKRKREFNDSDETLYEGYKKNKTEEDAIETVEQTQSENPKRDREHATILVENLPENVSESRLRQYFSHCGTVKALKLLENKTSAIVEFDSDETARYALSRDGQTFDDEIISVVLDTGSTVFLTNYAPESGEADIREILQPYGELISVRFPSLQGNKRRRFCYVQFKLPAQAQSAVDDLDGKEINGFSIACKISNPAIKKSRAETTVNDGRTLFVGGINFKATEDELQQEFTKYGNVELIRMPLHETMKTRNKGIAFITYSSMEEANNALTMNGMHWKGRDLKVEVSKDGESRSARQSSLKATRINGKADRRSSSTSVVPSEPRSERTIFLVGVPDTVNEARLRQIATKYGEVVKVILKTNHQGAIIEYDTVAHAGAASLGLDEYEIVPDRKVNVVTEEEMKTQKSEKKTDGFVAKPKAKSTTSTVPANNFVKRPAQPGNRTRKGGNLGQRNVLLHTYDVLPPPSKASEQQSNGVAGEPDAPKSNSDFRAMIRSGNQSQK